MQVAASLMIASVGSTIVGSGRSLDSDVAGGVQNGAAHVLSP
jgi:hypothetical protein